MSCICTSNFGQSTFMRKKLYKTEKKELRAEVERSPRNHAYS